MRRLVLLLAGVTVVIVGLSVWQPGAFLPPPPTVTPTMLPDDFTLIPTFVPSYPCELQVVDVRDDALCRNESVTERVVVEGDGVSFIQYDYHMGQGCWHGSTQDIRELRVCQKDSGAVTTLTDDLVNEVILSPDGEWLLYGTMNRYMTGEDSLEPHVFKIRRDGTGLQQLDSRGFPEEMVGAPFNLHWLDSEWIGVTLWDGTENGYHPYRLKADGSGEYEAMPDDTAEADVS